MAPPRKRKASRQSSRLKRSRPAAAALDASARSAGNEISASNLSLHELFEQQARDLLDRADLDEEQKQSILVAMSCPCCGAGGMSYTVKLKCTT